MPRAEEARLIVAIQNADPEPAWAASFEWQRCADTLHKVADKLVTCTLDVPDGEAGHLTATQMNAAFTTSAQALRDRAEALHHGSQALSTSGDAIHTAKHEHHKLGPEPGTPGAFQPVDDDPNSDKSINAKKDYDAGVADYEAKMAHREKVSKEQNTNLDTTFTASSKTMKEIHGEPDPPQPERAPSDNSPGGKSPVTPTGHPPRNNNDDDGDPRDPKDPKDPKDPTDDNDPTDDDPTNNNNDNDPPTTVGPVPPYDPTPPWLYDPNHPGTGTPTPGTPGTTATPGGGLPGIGTAVGAGAGVAGGGIAAAALSGGLRNLLGGQVTPVSAAGGATSGATGAAGRAIGSGARASSSGVLGRTGSSTSGASGVAGRGGTGARGAGAAGRGSSSRSGGKAAAGSRGGTGGRGAGAAGRGKGNKDDERGKAHELFDVDEDWTGDEDGAPPVLQ